MSDAARPTRRQMIAGGTGLLVAGSAAAASGRKAAPRRAIPPFLWGTAISGHQSEGNNVNADTWLLENLSPSAFAEPSGDACDSYARYEQDLDIAASLGLNCYRFGIEWSRIEPEQRRFSNAALDHYERVLEACHARKLLPIVTYNHFTVPRWFAERGGFEVADGADLFAAFADHTTRRLGSLIGMASTFNEANIVLLRRLLHTNPKEIATAKAMIAAAAKHTASPNFSSLLFGDPDRITEVMLDAHAKAFAAIKAGPGDFPLGVSLSMQDFQGVGDGNVAAQVERDQYGGWIEAARKADFIGVQTYSRLRVGTKGLLPSPPDAELTAAGYEYYPAAVGATIRYAAKHIGKPIYLTETGIATEDDTRRIAFIKATIEQVRLCAAEGIDVRGYLYWSLLDNFEWASGYSKHFGLVAVDRATFRRTLKPSAHYLGSRAKAGRL